ncbi:hypothetical protein [Actinotalea sp.]|uniref:hypothetical protein n=1 Tax=Actinotalea sp. TaxID=1872145 RepID=UPI002CF84572|nr:hypothetical protein [Actinotalea sp.]HRA50217.1 hypothetical protein [Actinotalea sp.]
MTGLSALGPWPGHKVLKAQQIAFDALADTPGGVTGIPPLVQMPKRGPWAESTARTAALLPEMPVEHGPHGWKLADRPGIDLERTQALLREDVDALAVAGYGYTGPLAVTARGPWSLAATLYLARGDRVLSDHGAVRELAASLAQGLADHLAAVRTALPGAQPVVVLREPALPDVLGGAVATFSGHSRIAPVPGERAVVLLGELVRSLTASGATQVVLHGGARFASRSLAVLAGSGAQAVGVAAASVRGQQWEQVAAVVEQGTRLWLGLPRESPRKGGPDIRGAANLISRPWRALGLPAAGLADIVVHTDTSGSGDQVLGNLQAMRLELHAAAQVAAELAERAEAG